MHCCWQESVTGRKALPVRPGMFLETVSKVRESLDAQSLGFKLCHSYFKSCVTSGCPKVMIWSSWGMLEDNISFGISN